jgi:hypothetical protein
MRGERIWWVRIKLGSREGVKRKVMSVFSYRIVGIKRVSKGGKGERCILGGQQE